MRKIDVTPKGAGRQLRAQIAQDTLKSIKGKYKEEPGLSVLYTEDNDWESIENVQRLGFSTRFEVTNLTTIEAMCQVGANRAADVLVLNFASAKNIGGGFKKGSNAQEESLARSSSLYTSLCRFEKSFYQHNKRFPGTYSERSIYSPQITFLKSDNGKLLPEPFVCSVLSVPAINKGVAKCSAAECNRLMQNRMRRILCVAAEQKKRVLVLGAFGCGVFKNAPSDVAAIWKDLLLGEFKDVFEVVHFACYGPVENRQPFVDAFKEV